MNLKHFTLLELGHDSESPMIGTIPNVSENEKDFKSRIKTALEEHFDARIRIPNLPDLFCGSPYEDVAIYVDGYKREIRILETWLY